MTPITYMLDTDDSFYGPFATAKEACDYALKSGFRSFAVLELIAP
jgi:hypothetical protein